MYLTTDVDANMNGFLRGQNPTNTKTTTYVFIAPKANGVVDLYYWIFCPFNLGKTVSFLSIGVVGNHVGDWERVTVRTVNGVATSVDYHAHGDTGSGTIPWAQTPKFSPSSPNSPPTTTNPDPNARPVAYVSNGSHGFWVSAGTFTYVNAVVFQLQDITSDGGVYWDTQNSLTTLNYPDTYSGDQNWLNYAGAWGNKAVKNCWWSVFYDECKLVAGPIGPVRSDVLGSAKLTTGALLEKTSMGLPSQTLATISPNSSSSFSIYLDSAPALVSGQTITVNQVCATLNATSIHEPSTPSYSYTSTYASSPVRKGATRYTIEVAACEDGSHVSAYSLGICAGNISESASLEEDLRDCSFGAQRPIRAFSNDPNANATETAAVIVTDLDNWHL
ncbi:Vacuolar protein sorting-associated protein 62 [Serendipita sp. 399]|nr:Vacuolar protein sorting-associated protein 62 [Serendipita sp. 399]